MEKHVSIETTEALPEGMDYDALRLRGIAYAQNLSGDIWTDYNEHDPGVTLLEHLCYALTDLSYRAGFDVEDILYAEEPPGPDGTDNGFYPPVHILPTAPVTATDYRRLLIDRVRGIRNVWFQPIHGHNRGYRGLFRLRIQLVEGAERKQRSREIVREVRDLVMANRNLCEDLQEIIVLDTEFLSIAASIHIAADAFGEKVLAEMLHTLEQTLNPGIRYYSQEELERKGYTKEEIFDGPAPLHGFVREEDLKPLPKNTHVSTLREAISRVKGVKLVNDLVVWKNGQRIPGDEIVPSPDSSLRLDPQLVDGNGINSGIRLLRNGVPVAVNARQTRQYLNTLAAKAKRGFQTRLNVTEPAVVPGKRKPGLSAYRSIQHHLPAVYGLGEQGLPATADRERRAKAFQLRGYLLIFEQFMADYLAQLTHVRTLFSTKPEGGRDACFKEHTSTYFSQFPADIPDAEELINYTKPKSTGKEKVASKPSRSQVLEWINEDLRSVAAKTDPSDKRRNRFLDHLLARFGEVYHGDALRFVADQQEDTLNAALARGKARFLSAYPEISRERSKAFNYRAPAWENANVSGLKKRVTLSLNLGVPDDDTKKEKLPAYANRSLSPTDLLQGATLSSKEGNSEGSSPSLSFQALLREGTKQSSYDIIRAGTQYELRFTGGAPPRDPGAAAGAENVEERGTRLHTGTHAACVGAREHLIGHLARINARGEGFYLLENILLRPGQPAGSVLVLEDQLPEGAGTVRIHSVTFSDEQTLNELSTDLLVIATHESNWLLLQDGSEWRTVLLRSGQPVMLSMPYPSERKARVIRQHLFSLFKRIREQDPASLNNYLRLEVEHREGFLINAGFYSLRLSVVAPAWPALFQNHDFRQLFRQAVATSVPAHLSVDYYWLPPGEMVVFEDTYQQWLAALRNEQHEKAQVLALKIIYQLRPDKVPVNTDGKPKGRNESRLPASIFKKLGDAFGYAFLFSTDDFGWIQGMPPAVAHLLPDLRITSWAKLARAKSASLAESLFSLDLVVSADQVRHWQKQATLARAGRWKDLLRYQRKTIDGEYSSTPSISQLTKVEKAVRTVLRSPGRIKTVLIKWLDRQPTDKVIPYPILEYLATVFGYGFVLPTSDLLVFSCIDADHQTALNKVGISTWTDLIKLEEDTWNAVLRKLDSTDDLPELPALHQEVQLAIDQQWEELIKRQSTGQDAAATAVDQRFWHHLELLMAPANGASRLLTERLKNWPSENVLPGVSETVTKPLLDLLSFNDLLADDDFTLFEGVGPKTAAALREAGIDSWKKLANHKLADLLSDLEDRLPAVALRTAGDWLVQAHLAAGGEWATLIEWQKDRLLSSVVDADKLTALEKGINHWLERCALPVTAPPAP